jgi:hypothetical protein
MVGERVKEMLRAFLVAPRIKTGFEQLGEGGDVGHGDDRVRGEFRGGEIGERNSWCFGGLVAVWAGPAMLLSAEAWAACELYPLPRTEQKDGAPRRIDASYFLKMHP